MQFSSFIAGSYWSSECFCTGCGLCYYCICIDWIWMDCCQILLVSILHVFLTIVLHLLWHDDCCRDTKPPHFFHNFRCILFNMESLFWIHSPTTCKFFHLISIVFLFFIPPLSFTDVRYYILLIFFPCSFIFLPCQQ